MNAFIIKALVAAVLFFCIGNSVVSLVSYANQRHNCQQTELLKQRVRTRAVEDYKNLPKTLKLLHLKETPEIRAKAKEQRDRLLNDYAAQKCVGLFG